MKPLHPAIESAMRRNRHALRNNMDKVSDALGAILIFALPVAVLFFAHGMGV